MLSMVRLTPLPTEGILASKSVRQTEIMQQDFNQLLAFCYLSIAFILRLLSTRKENSTTEKKYLQHQITHHLTRHHHTKP
jgi:hypothetical protein